MFAYFLLAAIPALFWLGYEICTRKNPAEFIFAGVAIVLLSYPASCISKCGAEEDTEIWSGRIVSKDRDIVSCEHSYQCNCTTDRDTQVTSCNTCYEHSHDIEFTATTSNDEIAYSSGHLSPGSSAPDRWNAIRLREPTAIEHTYTNYILASPDTILKRHGVARRYRGRLLAYPRVRDHYRSQRVLGNARVPKMFEVNDLLSEVNADLGRRYQVNVILVLTRESNPEYAEALREHWLGGKKNDVIVVVGMPRYPDIAWVRVLTWSERQEFSINLRNRIQELRRFNAPEVMTVLRSEIRSGFRRRPMADFQYLEETLAPGWGSLIFFALLTLGIAAAAFFAYANNKPHRFHY